MHTGPTTSTTELIGRPATFRVAVTIIAIYALLTALVVPVAGRSGPEIPGITAAFVATLFATEICTCFLLFVRFRETGALPVLVLAAAYGFSALMAVAHLLVFPGAIMVGRAVLETSRQSPGWIFLLWINGYAALCLAAVLLETRAGARRLSPRQVRRAAATAAVAVLGALAAIVTLTTAFADLLPLLIGDGGWTGLNRMLDFAAIAMLLAGIVLILLRLRSELFLWLALALTAMACANILSEAGGARYSIGWTVGRISWLFSACALVVYFLDQYGRQREALRASEQRFQLLVEGVKDYAIYMLDARGIVTSWNNGAQAIKGYRSDEIVGCHVSEFYTPEDRQAGLPARALQMAEREGKYAAEGWRVRKDGTRFWASVAIDPIRDDKGRLIGFAKVTRDVTEQRKAQEALQQTRDRLFQSQKMEAVGQLTGGVAHDFNNLLTIIIGNLDTAKRRIGSLSGDAADQLNRVLGNARAGAERAATLTQSLLAFSRRQPLSPRALDVNRFITGAVEFLQRSLGETINVEAVGGAGLWQIEADRNQLEAALLNLALNARDAMPGGGKLTIETANAFLDEDYCRANPEIPPGQYVLISVSDTGVGMTEEVIAHAFEPFFTTKGAGRGTGLGLSQVYGFVKQSGGHVRIYSEPGHGTTVKVYLPRLIAEPKPEESVSSDAAGKGFGETILVVEDDPDVRDYIVEALQELGYRVLEAKDAETALQTMQKIGGRIDLLLSDVILPGLNGRELARKLHERWPQLKVLYMTGYSRNAIVHHGRLDPGVEVVQKPLTQSVLAERIRRLLDAAGPR